MVIIIIELWFLWKINGIDYSFKCDTGSWKTIVSLEFFKKHKFSRILKQDNTI